MYQIQQGRKIDLVDITVLKSGVINIEIDRMSRSVLDVSIVEGV